MNVGTPTRVRYLLVAEQVTAILSLINTLQYSRNAARRVLNTFQTKQCCLCEQMIETSIKGLPQYEQPGRPGSNTALRDELAHRHRHNDGYRLPLHLVSGPSFCGGEKTREKTLPFSIKMSVHPRDRLFCVHDARFLWTGDSMLASLHRRMPHCFTYTSCMK